MGKGPAPATDIHERPKEEGERGTHRDGGKPRLSDTLPPELILEAGRIFALNSAPTKRYPGGKYPDVEGMPNFKQGIRTSKLLDSCYRHLLALMAGEDVDYESKYDHVGHLLCDLAMFWWMVRNRPDLDDRGSGDLL